MKQRSTLKVPSTLHYFPLPLHESYYLSIGCSDSEASAESSKATSSVHINDGNKGRRKLSNTSAKKSRKQDLEKDGTYDIADEELNVERLPKKRKRLVQIYELNVVNGSTVRKKAKGNGIRPAHVN
jgi:hypothetical protein